MFTTHRGLLSLVLVLGWSLHVEGVAMGVLTVMPAFAQAYGPVQACGCGSPPCAGVLCSSSTGQCEGCDDGYFLDEASNSCVPCSVLNCASCPEGPAFCSGELQEGATSRHAHWSMASIAATLVSHARGHSVATALLACSTWEQ